MGKSVDPAVLDAALNDIKNSTEKLFVCEGEPADYAGAVAQELASASMDPAKFTGPADDVSGRKLTVNGLAGVLVGVTGTADHIALIDDTNTRLIYVTTIQNPQTITATNSIDIDPWDINLEDPT